MLSKITAKIIEIYTFLKALVIELWANGKMLSAFLINEVPGITSTPGVVTAYQTAMHDQTKASYVDLLVQILIALAALHSAKKVVVKAKEKSESPQ